jgi:hypothetical protein
MGREKSDGLRQLENSLAEISISPEGVDHEEQAQIGGAVLSALLANPKESVLIWETVENTFPELTPDNLIALARILSAVQAQLMLQVREDIVKTVSGAHRDVEDLIARVRSGGVAGLLDDSEGKIGGTEG